MYDADEGRCSMSQRRISKPHLPRLTRREQSDIKHITKRDGEQLLDRQARKYLNMSGVEFKRQYHAGMLDAEDSRVIRVSFLLPLAKD